MKKLPWLNAAGVVAALTLNLWTARTGAHSAHLLDLIGSLLVAELTVAIGWYVSGFMTVDRDRRGFISFVFGFWGVLFNTIQVFAATSIHPVFAQPLIAAVVWTLLCALAAWTFSLGKPRETLATRVLAFSTIFLVLTQSASALQGLLEKDRTDSPVNRRTSSTPDVYVILLDKYSSGAWMQRNYGVNLQPFEDSLRALGFVIPGSARANYAHTELALASFLDWRYLDPSHMRGDSWAAALEMLQHARIWRYFHSHGYRVVTFPTNFRGTRHFPQADRELRWPGMASSPLARTWLINSPLGPLAAGWCHSPRCPPIGPMPYPTETVRELQWKFNTVASLPDSAGPIFAFVHVLSPHEPYLFNPDCSQREPWWPLSDQGEDQPLVGAAYASQVKCLNRLILAMVTDLIRRSAVPPVVILQADHGHGRLGVNSLRGITLTASRARPQQIGERMGIFAAYRFPGADRAVYADISPVNVVPLVLQSIFPEHQTLLPDRSFWSTYQEPLKFTEVPGETTHPPLAQASVAPLGTTKEALR